MTLCIKKLLRVVLITLSTVYCLLSTTFAADVSPSPFSPSPSPPPIKGEGENVAEEAIQIPDPVATINGIKITKGELERLIDQGRAMEPGRFDAMGPDERKIVLNRMTDSLIVREMMYQEATKRNIVIPDGEMEINIEAFKGQFPSDDAFGKALSDAGMTIPAWKEETRKNLMLMRLEETVVDGLSITDSEIESYYKENEKEINKDAIKVSHILVATEEEAKKIAGEFKEREDFGVLAKKYSLDNFTKDKGGDLGWFVRGALIKEVEDAAYSLSPGEISPPVKSQFGYHIIRLDEKKSASEQTLEDHRDHIRSILQQARWREMRSAWIGGLLSKAKVWKWSP